MTDRFYEHLFGVRGRAALVTGGSRGIGKLIAEGLVRAGAMVYVSSRKADVCDAVAAELSKYGDCFSLPADLSTIAGCDALVDRLARQVARLDILVNNAGVSWSAPLADFSEKAWDRVVELDMKAPFFLIQRCLGLLRSAATSDLPASVVNIGSVNALMISTLSNFSYVAAKAGLHVLTRQLAYELAGEHINVNSIAPGLFKSMMTAPLYANEETERAVLAATPMGRWGSMEDIAGLTIFLSSRAGAYVTGTVIACDGGATMHGR